MNYEAVLFYKQLHTNQETPSTSTADSTTPATPGEIGARADSEDREQSSEVEKVKEKTRDRDSVSGLCYCCFITKQLIGKTFMYALCGQL